MSCGYYNPVSQIDAVAGPGLLRDSDDMDGVELSAIDRHPGRGLDNLMLQQRQSRGKVAWQSA